MDKVTWSINDGAGQVILAGEREDLARQTEGYIKAQICGAHGIYEIEEYDRIDDLHVSVRGAETGDFGFWARKT